MNKCLESAQNSLQIQAINLIESKISVNDDLDLPALNREETTVQSFRSVAKIKEITLTDTYDKEVLDYRFIYAAGIRLIFSNDEGKSGNDDYKPIIEIATAFEAKYFSQKKLNEDERKAFSVDNVGYHVWPYWREYVQSSCARIGFSPAFEIPVYIVHKNKEEPVSSE